MRGRNEAIGLEPRGGWDEARGGQEPCHAEPSGSPVGARVFCRGKPPEGEMQGDT